MTTRFNREQLFGLRRRLMTFLLFSVMFEIVGRLLISFRFCIGWLQSENKNMQNENRAAAQVETIRKFDFSEL